MAPPVANSGGSSVTHTCETPYEDYLLERGLRYLTPCKQQRKVFYRQFVQLFISAFKFCYSRAPHGHLWGIDEKVIDFLQDAVRHGELPGIEIRINIGGGEMSRHDKKRDGKRPDPAVVVLFSDAADEETTVKLICMHILKQLTKAYDHNTGHFMGYSPGRQAPWIIGFIEVVGLCENGFFAIPMHVKHSITFDRTVPDVANLFIVNLCYCHPVAICKYYLCR